MVAYCIVLDSIAFLRPVFLSTTRKLLFVFNGRRFVAPSILWRPLASAGKSFSLFPSFSRSVIFVYSVLHVYIIFLCCPSDYLIFIVSLLVNLTYISLSHISWYMSSCPLLLPSLFKPSHSSPCDVMLSCVIQNGRPFFPSETLSKEGFPPMGLWQPPL